MALPDMTRGRLLRLKNRMLGANIVSNVIGVTIIQVMILRAEGPVSEATSRLSQQIDRLFIPCAFVFGIICALVYERPIRRVLDTEFSKLPPAPALLETARRRLLNEPFFMMGVDLFLWLSASAIYSTLFFLAGAGPVAVQRAVFGSLCTGLITATVAFFLLERILQIQLVPLFFADGRLHATAGTLRIRIRTRLLALLLACNLVPFFATLTVLHRLATAGLDPAEALSRLRHTLFLNCLVFMATGVWLTFLVSRNLTEPLREIVRVLRGIRRGRLDDRARVTSNDEIGYTGDVINEMTAGLRERERMQASLNLAKEVQQRLLPQSDPRVPGWDIAGRSLYCDETGGDYYDFLDAGDGRLGVVVGDVSGHGLPAALLMATARSLLRQRVRLPGGIAEVLTDVNCLLAGDIGASGQFMTLFFLSLAPGVTCVQWVRAGHEPALLYDPRGDRFAELRGAGIAMGIDGDWRYSRHATCDLSDEQIILMCTDGLHEARNEKGEMFGKERLFESVRAHARRAAAGILAGVMSDLVEFQGCRAPEDDITLVVVKAARRIPSVPQADEAGADGILDEVRGFACIELL